MIKLSKKGDYGVEVLMVLSSLEKGELMSIKQISESKGLPIYFLGQIMSSLKKGGLVESKEGVGGGYKLIKNPKDITLLDIFDIFEGKTSLVDCAESGNCKRANDCIAVKGWMAINRSFIKFFKSKTLQNLLDECDKTT